MSDPLSAAPVKFGLIVVGDEVLNGARVDGHLPELRRMIQDRGHELAWFWLLPDDPETLTAHFGLSMARRDPVLVCGGIGATPDDHTRACAAAAAGVRLERHPEARALLEERFGEAAYPNRILMADLPVGAELIPNPVNRIPGFSLRGHWFLPGFPQMAWPMAEWLLDTAYGRCDAARERAVSVRGVPESALIPLMQRLETAHPGLKLFSLPHMGTDSYIELGFRGRMGLDAAMDDLRRMLEAECIHFDAGPSAVGRAADGGAP